MSDLFSLPAFRCKPLSSRTTRATRNSSQIAAYFLCSAFVALTMVSPSPANDVLRQNHTPTSVAEDYDPTPVNYIYGLVLEKNLIRDNKGKFATNITFKPRYVSDLLTESVLFCGNRAEEFDQADGPIVVSYSRVAHSMIKDVPCFNLVSIDRVESSIKTISAK